MRASVLNTRAGSQRFCQVLAAPRLACAANSKSLRASQKCHALHDLTSFEGDRHACIAKLEELSRRRRARRAAAPATAGSCVGSDPAARTADVRHSSPSSEDSPWPEELQDLFSAAASASDSGGHASCEDEVLPLLLFGPSDGMSLQPQLEEMDEAKWPWPLPECTTLELKLPAAASPTLFPSSGLRSELLSTREFDTPVLQAQAAVRPGCTLLSLDLHALPPKRRQGAEPLLAALLARSSFVARQARAAAEAGQRGVQLSLRGCGSSNTAARSGPGSGWRALFAPGLMVSSAFEEDSASVPRTRASPLALLSTRDALLHVTSAVAGGGAANALWVRVNGQYLATEPATSGDAMTIVLPASGATGCALVEVEYAGAVSGTPLHVLLCTDAAIVVELTATGVALSNADCSEVEWRRLQRAVWALGCALAAHAAPHVVAATPHRRRVALAAAGAAASMRYGWSSALCACLRALQAAAEGCDSATVAAAVVAPSGASLLHQAAMCNDGDAEMVKLTLLHAPAVQRGRATSRDVNLKTPLHFAARAGNLAAVRVLCDASAAAADIDAVADASDAALDWLCARDCSGRTPAEAAQSVFGLSDLNASLRARAAAGIAYARATAAAVNPEERGLALPAHAVEAVLSSLGTTENVTDAHQMARALLRQLARAIEVREARMDDTTASAGAMTRLFGSSSTPPSARLHAYRSTLLLTVFISTVCVFSRALNPVLDDAAIAASMPEPPWDVWQRTPTVMCCSGAFSGPVPLLREAALVVFALVGLMPLHGTLHALRDKHIVTLHAALVFFFLLFDVSICAYVTYSRYGARFAAEGMWLRMQWQSGIKQVILSIAYHFSTEMRLPPTIHAALFGMRGVLPLLVRVAEAGSPAAWLAPVARLRLLTVHVGWDVVHAAVIAACIVHNVATQRRRHKKTQEVQSRLAKVKDL